MICSKQGKEKNLQPLYSTRLSFTFERYRVSQRSKSQKNSAPLNRLYKKC